VIGIVLGIFAALMVVGVVFLVIIGAIIGIAAGPSADGDPAKGVQPTLVQGPVGPETPVNTAGGGVPTLKPLGDGSDDGRVSATVAGGSCASVSNERNRGYYYAYKSLGSAKRLRGKVLVMHLRFTGRRLKFTRLKATEIDEAAMVSSHFVRHQANERGIGDLKYDVASWTLETPFDMPTLRLLPSHMLDESSVRELDRETRAAVETSLGKPLEGIAAEMKTKHGYDEVGFLIYLPVKTEARAFAEPVYKRAQAGKAEMAYLFEKASLGPLSYTVTHEGLHLFGADDLYRIRGLDASEKNDIMNAYCLGLGKATVGDATAWAIGWQDTAPSRSYTFKTP